MHKLILKSGLLLTALAQTPAAGAEGGKYDRYDNGPYTDSAEVIDVQPIHTTVRVETPRRECWEEEVRYRDSGYYHGDSYTPTILGGIVGGVAGHQFGKGDGNTLMTIAGALLGGSIGNDHARYSRAYGRGGGYSTTTETRCSTRTEYHEEERIDGYRVRYSYAGRVYTTRMGHHPGTRVRVNVNVTPAEQTR